MKEKLDEIEAKILTSPYRPEKVYLDGEFFNSIVAYTVNHEKWFELFTPPAVDSNVVGKLFGIPIIENMEYEKTDEEESQNIRVALEKRNRGYFIEFDNNIRFCDICGNEQFYDQQEDEFYCNHCEHKKLQEKDVFFLKRLLFKS